MIKKKSLVTGCAGFIGSHVCEELILMGHEVIGIDDLSGGFIDNLNKNVIFFRGSITDNNFISEIFSQNRFDYIFHLAAYAAEGLSHFIKRFNYTNNLLGSINLINAAINSKSVKCFIFTSSIAVYGKNQLPMTEDLEPKPEDPYGIAKYAVELDLKESLEIFDLNYIIFRPHNVYGERQNIGDNYRNVIGIFMNQMMQNKPLTIFGDGTQTRAFSYIADVAPIIARSAERNETYNQIFNVGADKPYSILELASTIGEKMGIKPKLQFVEARNEVIHAFSSHEKLNKFFSDLNKMTSLEDGVTKMSEWAIKHGAKQSKIFNDIEVNINLPPIWANL